MSTPRFGRYPWSSRITVARDAGRSARRVRRLAGTSDRRRDLLDRAGAAAIAVTGTARRAPTAPWPWPLLTPHDLVELLAASMPGLSLVGAVAPRQAGRRRLSLLARFDRHDVVIKLGCPDDGLEREAVALELLGADPLPSIATPRVIGAGRLDDAIAFIATSALGLDGQRPAIGERLRTFESDLGERLGSLPHPPGESDRTVVPVHGDLTPWNLRRTSRGLALFDWETAGWGAPGADLEHYRSACAALRA